MDYKDTNSSSESADFKCHSHEDARAQPGQALSTIPPEANSLGLCSAWQGRWLCTWQTRCAVFKNIRKGFTLKLGLFLIRPLQNFISNLHTKINFLDKKVLLYKHNWFALVHIQLNGANSIADFNDTSNS